MVKHLFCTIFFIIVTFSVNATSSDCFIQHGKPADWLSKNNIKLETGHPTVFDLAYAYKPINGKTITVNLANQIESSISQCGCTIFSQVFDGNISGTCSTFS